MKENAFTEAEMQALIIFIELEQPKETPNNNHYSFYPKSVAEAVRYFKGFDEDWMAAIESLRASGLVEPGPQAQQLPYKLTPTGLQIANQVRNSRPPIYYWYREYAIRTANSRAFAEFCQKLYGMNLCQANFSDMEQIEKLVEVTRLNESSHVLDLGCNKGMIAEYLSDRTGAQVTGIDYTPEAIEQALDRTISKRSRLNFVLGNLDDLDFPPASFDTLISIDTLYMPNDLDTTLQKMSNLLTPGGQIAALYSDWIGESGTPISEVGPERTQLGQSLFKAGWLYQVWDFSAQTYLHMQRKRQIGLEMQSKFEAEGNLVLYNYIIAESESSPEPFDPEKNRMRRYLYRIIPGPQETDR